jgi:hypothetical protein
VQLVNGNAVCEEEDCVLWAAGYASGRKEGVDGQIFMPGAVNRKRRLHTQIEITEIT